MLCFNSQIKIEKAVGTVPGKFKGLAFGKGYVIQKKAVPKSGKIIFICRNFQAHIFMRINNLQGRKYKMDKCPKCCFERNQGDKSCPQCGVIYEIYDYYLNQRKLDEEKEKQYIVCPSCGTDVLKNSAVCPNCEGLLCFDSAAASYEERLERLKTYSFGQTVLREREYFFEKIYTEQEMNPQIRYFALYSLLFSCTYGLVLGMFAGKMQIMAAFIKIPLLLFGTLGICLPALYLLNILVGSKLSFRQTLTLLLGSNYLMSVFLASLSPILFFFIILTTAKRFISILNVIIFCIAGFFALRLIKGGMRYLTVRSDYSPKFFIIEIWFIIYVMVGIQFAWILRPFIGEKGEKFAFFRDIEGNFYLAISQIISDFFR